jgi:hypothetical protein
LVQGVFVLVFVGVDGSVIARKCSRGGVFVVGFDMCTCMWVCGVMRVCGLMWVIVAVCCVVFG